LETTPVTLAAKATVEVALSGLKPNSEYHLRFVATNKDGKAEGSDVAFTTYMSGGGVLPDNRVYEEVSVFGNPYSETYLPGAGVGITNSSLYPFEAAPDGDEVTFVGNSSSGGGNGSSGFEGHGNQYLARRSPTGGWTPQNISSPGDLFSKYKGFTSNLSVGVAQILTTVPFVASEAPYLTEGYAFNASEGEHSDVLYTRALDGSVFQPLMSVRPHRHVVTGGPVASFNEEFGGQQFGGVSADGSHVLFSSDEALVEGEGRAEKELQSDLPKEIIAEKEALKLNEEEEKLTGEAQVLTNACPRNVNNEPECSTGAKKEINEKDEEAEQKKREEEQLLYHNTAEELYVATGGHYSLVNVLPDGALDQNATFGSTLSHVISGDGSRVFWTSSEGGPEGETVFVRENGTSTVQVSQGAAHFWTASPDGKYAFYTEGGKLWRFDVENESRVELAGREGGVEGVIGTNETGEDGAYVYFVALEKLTSEANYAGKQAVEGEENLYVYEPDSEHAGQSKIAFIAAPTEENDWNGRLARRTANLTPNGHGLVFESQSNLTAGAYPDERAMEVYVYDTEGGNLYCASCRRQASGGFFGQSNQSTYVYRWISEDGDRVFFDSDAALVPRDVGDVQQVYEWEREGSGECHEADGCDYLVSGGAEGEAAFVDASASGNDVFFTTPAKLVPEDEDEAVDLYDARVDGLQPVSPPLCTGAGCQGVPAPAPTFATPASVTFAGVGNFSAPSATSSGTAKQTKALTRRQQLAKALAACHKMRRKHKRAACEAHARKAYGAKATRAKAIKTIKREGR
jgi:hypothetical protein